MMKERDLEQLLKEMSLKEKIGQMVQIPAQMLLEGGIVTGPSESVELTEEMISLVGSVLGRAGAKELYEIQKAYVEKHPHHIPLLLMFDVVNGMETIFPIPLAQGCTFSAELVRKAAEVSAKEAAAEGLHVTFSPMTDLVRDPRWGRVMESTGEDPWLNAELGRAMVCGYQGTGKKTLLLNEKGKISGCVKHFAAYGAPEGGRDYDTVEISERSLKEDYLPAYQAAIEEGCAMVMTSFNTWNRIPSSGNRWLLRKILREEMGFEGVVISDYAAVDEMVKHGIAEDSKEAAKLAIMAGVDIDMVSTCYVKYLEELVRDGEVSETLIDEAVLRILRLKNALGLFENPYKDGNEMEEAALLLNEEHRLCAREVAAASFVLLKNEGDCENKLLPLKKDSEQKVSLIGPYADEKEIYGSWSFPKYPEKTITIREGIEKKRQKTGYAKGCIRLDHEMHTRFGKTEACSEEEAKTMRDEAIKLAKASDVVVLCIGEHKDQTGEGGSRSDIRIPERQLQLLKELREVNENIVSVVFSGRPVELDEIEKMSKAVLMVWMPGTEGGNAIADVLYGDTIPQGKLSMSIPRSNRQIPVYYNHLMTGRPNETGTKIGYCNGYIDESVYPLHPFGYGLSYTTFQYSKVSLDRESLTENEKICASVEIRNTGKLKGTETVQMYLTDIKGSVARPVKMLRGVKKVTLEPGECRRVEFEISEKMLRFYDIEMNYVSEAGRFYVSLGSDSTAQNRAEFFLEKRSDTVR